jgi:cytochrome oxidase Cu insertion factor (SCO1/SenC/PrrC family)
LKLRAIALGGLLLVAGGSPAALPRETAALPPLSLEYTYALGTFAPEYAPPEPGSYSLPVIQRVGDHPLVDSNGERTSLFTLKGKRAAIVAFVYTSCAEATGCPFSTAVLHRLDGELAADPSLAPRVSLVTISFDPARDTPERLATIRALHRPKSDWRFATTSGEAELAPLLADFDQPAVKLRFPDGRWSGRFRHVLKVFLLDEENRVRNVYSVGFLNAELLLADLRTLFTANQG